jgi:hypothetical protein
VYTRGVYRLSTSFQLNCVKEAAGRYVHKYEDTVSVWSKEEYIIVLYP